MRGAFMNIRRQLSFLLLVLLILSGSAGLSYADTLFEKGITEFRAENYEEALGFFEQAYKNDPKDPNITLYIGLTRREMQDYPEAVKAFKETLALNPKAPDVKYLLGDALYGMGNYEEALGVTDEAIKDGSKPAQSAYLKGMILVKLKRNAEAVQAFNKAEELDPSLMQQADFQIAAVYVQEKDYKKAKDIFKGLITKDPTSDWAAFSKDYLEALEKIPPPYRLTLGFGYQYDDNVLAVPTVQGLVDVNKQADWKRIYSLYGEYALYAKGPWNVKASYALGIGQYNKSDYPKINSSDKVFSQDTVSHTVSVMPSYNTERGVASLLLSYNYLEVDYTKYMQSYTASPSYTFIIQGNHLGQVFVKYRKDDQNFDFFQKKFGSFPVKEEDRDADNFGGGAGYFYTLAGGNGLFNLRAEFDDNNAEGANWDYAGVKGSAGILYPFLNNRLKANVFGEYYHQQFKHVHTTYGVKRRDDTLTAQASLTYTLLKPLDVSVGYAYIRDDSNIGVFDFKKNLYTMSIEFRF